MAIDSNLSSQIARDLQRDFGLTNMQASAIVGNLAYESGNFKSMQEISPTVKGSRGGYGWAQWTGSRRNDFESYAKAKGLSVDSYAANYGFLAKELATTEKAAIEAVKQAKTLPEATKAFERSYERAGVKNYPARENYAQQALDAVAALDGIPGPLGGFPKTPFEGMKQRTGININPYATIATPTQRPDYTPSYDIHDVPQTGLISGTPAPSIMPAPETIAQNWGQYQTPQAWANPSQQDVDQAKESILSGLPTPQQDYSGTYGTLGRGLRENTNIPSLPTDYDAFREQMGARPGVAPQRTASQGITDIDSSMRTTVDNLGVNFSDLTEPAARPSPVTARTPVPPVPAGIAEQYGMYTNPQAKAFYDPVDPTITSIIGPNPQVVAPSTVMTPEEREFEEGRKRAEEEAERQQAKQRPGLFNPARGFLTDMIGDIGSGLFSGRDPVSAADLAGFISNAIDANGRGDLTSGRGIRTSSSGLGTSVTGGPSANFPGMDAHTNNYGVTTVSNDNMSFIDNSDGASAGPGKSVLCTHYYDKGWLDPEVYFSDALYGMGVPDKVKAGYHRWAIPLVKILETNPLLERVFYYPVLAWATSMHMPEKLWSKMLRGTGEFICRRIANG